MDNNTRARGAYLSALSFVETLHEDGKLSFVGAKEGVTQNKIWFDRFPLGSRTRYMIVVRKTSEVVLYVYPNYDGDKSMTDYVKYSPRVDESTQVANTVYDLESLRNWFIERFL